MRRLLEITLGARFTLTSPAPSVHPLLHFTPSLPLYTLLSSLPLPLSVEEGKS